MMAFEEADDVGAIADHAEFHDVIQEPLPVGEVRLAGRQHLGEELLLRLVHREAAHAAVFLIGGGALPGETVDDRPVGFLLVVEQRVEDHRQVLLLPVHDDGAEDGDEFIPRSGAQEFVEPRRGTVDDQVERLGGERVRPGLWL